MILALTIVNEDQLRRLLDRVWDAREFLSPFGIRSLSKAHEQHPFEFDGRQVGYEPAEAVSKIKGGNSNWRGPIWFPTSFLLIESLIKLAKAFGPHFTVTPPASNGEPLTFRDMARQIADRMIRIFARDASGHRPVYGGTTKFQEDPHWRDNLLFFEYFHGDNGASEASGRRTRPAGQRW